MRNDTSPPLPSQERRQFPLGLRAKMLIFFTLLFFVVFAAAFYWFFRFATVLAEDNLRQELADIAETVADGISGEAHTALIGSDLPAGRPVQDPRYLELVEWLAAAKELNGEVIALDGEETYRVLLYTYAATETPGTVLFTGSSSALNDPPSGAEFREMYQPQSAAMLAGLQETTVNLDVPITDQWGRWVSAFSPIHNADGAVVGAVGVDMRETTVVALQRRIRNSMLPAFLITYGVLFAAVWLLSDRISRPVVALTHSAEEVAAGNYDLTFVEDGATRFPDETSTLAAVFEEMVAKVAHREQRLKEEVQQLRIEIDESKRTEQVSEIVESEFFQEMQDKARKMRRRRKT